MPQQGIGLSELLSGEIRRRGQTTYVLHGLIRQVSKAHLIGQMPSRRLSRLPIQLACADHFQQFMQHWVGRELVDGDNHIVGTAGGIWLAMLQADSVERNRGYGFRGNTAEAATAATKETATAAAETATTQAAAAEAAACLLLAATATKTTTTQAAALSAKATATTTKLGEVFRYADNGFRQFHGQWLIGGVLDQHIPAEWVLLDQLGCELATFDASKQLNLLSVGVVLQLGQRLFRLPASG